MQFQEITALETMSSPLLLPPEEVADNPGMRAASLAADSPLRLRGGPKEAHMNQQREFTKYESSKMKTC